ncbi:hypothetical protein ACJX0J_021253, partial [Zea mays]
MEALPVLEKKECRGPSGSVASFRSRCRKYRRSESRSEDWDVGHCFVITREDASHSPHFSPMSWLQLQVNQFRLLPFTAANSVELYSVKFTVNVTPSSTTVDDYDRCMHQGFSTWDEQAKACVSHHFLRVCMHVRLISWMPDYAEPEQQISQ